MNKKNLTVVLSVILIVLIALAGFVWYKFSPSTIEGEKDITFTILYKDKTEEVIKIDTDKEYLAEALAEEGIITYDASGLYTTINGATADYNVDGGWWAIYVGDEMAQVGLNDIPVTDKGEYNAVYTIGFAS